MRVDVGLLVPGDEQADREVLVVRARARPAEGEGVVEGEAGRGHRARLGPHLLGEGVEGHAVDGIERNLHHLHATPREAGGHGQRGPPMAELAVQGREDGKHGRGPGEHGDEHPRGGGGEGDRSQVAPLHGFASARRSARGARRSRGTPPSVADPAAGGSTGRGEAEDGEGDVAGSGDEFLRQARAQRPGRGQGRRARRRARAAGPREPPPPRGARRAARRPGGILGPRRGRGRPRTSRGARGRSSPAEDPESRQPPGPRAPAACRGDRCPERRCRGPPPGPTAGGRGPCPCARPSSSSTSQIAAKRSVSARRRARVAPVSPAPRIAIVLMVEGRF